MSQPDRGSSLYNSSIKSKVACCLPESFFSNTSSTILIDTDDEDSLTETNSSTTTEESQYRYKEIENLNSFDSIKDCSPQTLKDWLKLAKTLINRNENSQNKHMIAKKSDELQDFFYFLAIEYISTNDFLVEFLEDKRKEFVNNWENIIHDSVQVFDILIGLIDDINLDTSFSTF